MNSNNKDSFFKNILQKSTVEKPSEDFTAKVMQSIQTIAFAENKKVLQHRSILNIAIIVVGGLIVLTATGYYLSTAGVSFIPENKDFILMPVFENILSYFTQIFESFSISPITIIILFGVLIIVLLEKIIRKLPPLKNIYFSL